MKAVPASPAGVFRCARERNVRREAHDLWKAASVCIVGQGSRPALGFDHRWCQPLIALATERTQLTLASGASMESHESRWRRLEVTIDAFSIVVCVIAVVLIFVVLN